MADTKTEKKAPEADTSEDATYTVDEPDKVIPAKGDAGYDTPSGFALAKAGDDPDKYAAEKAKKRWGY